jgi:hypothetical protein
MPWRPRGARSSDLQGASLEIPVGADAIEGYNSAKQALEAR